MKRWTKVHQAAKEVTPILDAVWTDGFETGKEAAARELLNHLNGIYLDSRTHATRSLSCTKSNSHLLVLGERNGEKIYASLYELFIALKGAPQP